MTAKPTAPSGPPWATEALRAHLGGAASFLAPTMPTFLKTVGGEGPCRTFQKLNLVPAPLGAQSALGPLVTGAPPCLVTVLPTASCPHESMRVGVWAPGSVSSCT